MADIRDIHQGYRLALAACGEGYSNCAIARTVAYKTALPHDLEENAPEQATNSVLAVSLAAAGLPKRPLKILDFGGGCGFHYLRVAPVVSASLCWAIVETPSMVEQALELARGRYTAHETITDALTSLGGHVDLVHTSGALQCLPNPLETLRSLAQLKAPYIALLRFPIWRKAEIVGVQVSQLSSNGIGPLPPGMEDLTVRYPVTFMPFGHVSAALHGYELILKTASPSADYNVDGDPAPGTSLIYRRID